MEDTTVWYKRPEVMAKCRERQRRYYEANKVAPLYIHCNACNKEFKEFYIHQHWRTKIHLKNDPDKLYGAFPESK